MATGVELGYQSSIYVNAGTYSAPQWVEVDLARDVTIVDTRDKIDVTTRLTARNGYKAQAPGLREFGLRFDVLVPATGETNTAYNTLEAARINGTTVDILHVEGGSLLTDGLNAFRVICSVAGGEKSEPLNGASTRSYDLFFTPNDDQELPQYGVVSGGEFVPSS